MPPTTEDGPRTSSCATGAVPMPTLVRNLWLPLKVLPPLRKATFVPATKPLGPAEFGAFLRAEVDKWAKVVREANITQQ